MTLYRAVSTAEERETWGSARFIEDAVKALRKAYWGAVRGNLTPIRLVIELRAEEAE